MKVKSPEKILLGFFIGYMFQSIFNIPNRPWFDDKNIYRGDRVVIAEQDGFYDKCDYADVLSIHRNAAFVFWHCANNESVPLALRGGAEDVVSIEFLRLKK